MDMIFESQIISITNAVIIAITITNSLFFHS